MDDLRVIQKYATRRSDDTFKALIDQYVGLVYSACYRHLKDRHLAEDAAQAVFLLFSQKSGTLHQSNIPGWLLTTSRYACANIRKSEQRRQRREQLAAMKPNTQTNTHHYDLLDLLDEAICHLKTPDRKALVLRYLKEQPLSDVAEKLGVSEDAARKRVDRSIEKLRQYFCRRGIITTSAALGAILREQLSGAALTMAARISITQGVIQVCHAGPHGIAASVAIAKGTKTMMLLTKLKPVAILATLAFIVGAIGTTTWIISRALADNPKLAEAAAPALIDQPPALALSNTSPVATKPTVGFAGSLANGVSFEILGIGENPSHNRPWWNPDGSPLPTPMFPEFDNRVETLRPNMLMREFVVHIAPPQDRTEAGPHVRWDVIRSVNRHVHINGDGPPPETGLDGAVFSLPDDPSGFTVRAIVAAGDWTTEFTVKGSDHISDSRAGAPGHPIKSFSCGPAISKNGKTSMTCAYSGLDGNDEEVRLIAMNAAGREYLAQGRDTSRDGGTTSSQFSYDIPLASITQWEFQSRRFGQWIEIRHVAARPGAQTMVEIATSDDARPTAIPTQPSAAATTLPVSRGVFHYESDHYVGSCGPLFDQTPAMSLSSAVAITSGIWRDDIRPSLVWSGNMTDQGSPNAPLELEIYSGGSGVLRTEYGWFPVSHFATSSSTMSFDLDASHEVNPNALDQKIVQRAAAILSTEAAWNRADNREYHADAKTWSIYCAMEKATIEITGGFHHRRPAMEVVRKIVDQRTATRGYHHRLMDYNNDSTTHLSDVQSLFKDALIQMGAGSP